MADIVTDAEILSGEWCEVSFDGDCFEFLKEVDGFGCRFQNTERFGFDGESYSLSGVLVQFFEERRQLQQVIDALVAKIDSAGELFESEGNRRDAPFFLILHQFRQNGRALMRVG